MGEGRWKESDWVRYATKNIIGKATVEEIYTAKNIDKDLNPKDIKMRESCDSVDNPLSSPLIVALDVTGSMGSVLDVMARDGLKTLATEVYNRKPITDPHIMFLGIGDVEEGDRAPLQATQFEADIRIAEQLSKIYLEKGGGGNNYESYALAWYFASMYTRIDSFEKRGKKGYLFTIGDELPTPYLRGCDIERVFGIKPQFDKIEVQELLTMVSRQYEVYHIMVENGNYFRSRGEQVVNAWTELLGQRAIRLSDHTKLAEVIVSTLQIENGADTDKVIKSWDGSTSLVVEKAVSSLSKIDTAGGIVRF
ncbi:MAG: hypothetical protein K0R54_691 [Clostridiaceae bacterium]|jgi:hypothetical protein|nr:hypothetical protein [Clostridiaceae bacterium]